LTEAVAAALSTLGWRPHANPSEHFAAETPANFWSWGENINVGIDSDGTVWVESSCKLPTQCLDWGKNRRNVTAFLGHVSRFLEAKAK
jgi:hypothetical protein